MTGIVYFTLRQYEALFGPEKLSCDFFIVTIRKYGYDFVGVNFKLITHSCLKIYLIIFIKPFRT